MKRNSGLIILFAALTFSGCASVAQSLDPNAVYKRDIALEVNGIKGSGVLVVPAAERYEIKGESVGKFDLLTLSSCHREHSAENLGNKFSYSYTPTPIERAGGCRVEIGGYERKKGRHAWAMVEFETQDSTLPAQVFCNGISYKSKGVTACQSRQGMIQSIHFDAPVKAVTDPKDPKVIQDSANPRCSIAFAEDAQNFHFEIPPGECTFAFMELGEPKRFHRLVTLGYQSILLRED